MAEIELTLNSPITEEQWDTITDVDFDYTNRIWFHTKHGKQVEFVKAKPATSNADRIRAMTDEELAVLLEGCICPSEPCKKVVNRERQPDKKMCQSCWLDWLKQEVDSDAT